MSGKGCRTVEPDPDCQHCGGNGWFEMSFRDGTVKREYCACLNREAEPSKPQAPAEKEPMP